MPALKNHRQERFCQLIKQGVPPYRAYPAAGYQANNGSPYRLHENARVKARLSELTKGMRMKTRVTVESITAQLDEDREFAKACAQAGPALQASIAKAKLHGLLIERKESGAPGDFGTLTTPEQVIDAIRAELGDKAADLLLASVAPAQGEGEAEGKPADMPSPGDTIN